MGLIHEEKSYAFKLRESANDGSDFSNPEADYRIVFLGEDGEWHSRDSAGSVAGFAGAGIAATLADAVGDLLVASGADAWARLAIGATNGMALRRVSGAVAWDLPPGHEFAYNEFTSGVTISATTEGTANEIVAASSVTFDGATAVIIECYLPALLGSATNGDNCVFVLADGGTSIGKPAQARNPAGDASNRFPGVHLRHRLTPSAAAHTYSYRAYRVSANWTVEAGAGGNGNAMPGFIRITKAT